MRACSQDSSEITLIIYSDLYYSPEGDLNLGSSRFAVFDNCKATALTTQPPWQDGFDKS